ncbi:MAG: GNAT family N-acetyltransferase [Oscillospiraceae bacterium]|nr:GNAT family N-acetyltransferase [Oscillospiraceae bacterium]
MKITLRKWDILDAGLLARYANNEKIARNLRDAFPYPYTLADAEAFIDGCLAANESAALCYAVELDGQAAGSIGLFRGSDIYRRNAEIGYWLAEEYWGRGVMTGAVRQLCAEGFRTWNIARIYAEPFADNLGSRRVLEKAGFALEGTMRRGAYKNGAYRDWCMYALLREDIE